MRVALVIACALLSVLVLWFYDQSKLKPAPNTGTQNIKKDLPMMLYELQDIDMPIYETHKDKPKDIHGLHIDLTLLLSRHTSSKAQEIYLNAYLKQLKELKAKSDKLCSLMIQKPWEYSPKHSYKQTQALFSPATQRLTLDAIRLAGQECCAGPVYPISDDTMADYLKHINDKYKNRPYRIEDRHRQVCNKQIDTISVLLNLPKDKREQAIANYMQISNFRWVIVF